MPVSDIGRNVGDDKDSVIKGAIKSKTEMNAKLRKVDGKLSRYDLELAYRKRLSGFQRTISFWSTAAVIGVLFIIVVTSMIDSTIASNYEKIQGLISTITLGVLGIPLTFLGAKTYLELRNPTNVSRGPRPELNDDVADPTALEDEEVDFPEDEPVKPKKPKGGANDPDAPAVKPPTPDEVKG